MMHKNIKMSAADIAAVDEFHEHLHVLLDRVGTVKTAAYLGQMIGRLKTVIGYQDGDVNAFAVMVALNIRAGQEAGSEAVREMAERGPIQ